MPRGYSFDHFQTPMRELRERANSPDELKAATAHKGEALPHLESQEGLHYGRKNAETVSRLQARREQVKAAQEEASVRAARTRAKKAKATRKAKAAPARRASSKAKAPARGAKAVSRKAAAAKTSVRKVAKKIARPARKTSARKTPKKR